MPRTSSLNLSEKHPSVLTVVYGTSTPVTTTDRSTDGRELEQGKNLDGTVTIDKEPPDPAFESVRELPEEYDWRRGYVYNGQHGRRIFESVVCRTVPDIVRSDCQLYCALAIIDAIRLGNEQQRAAAVQALHEVLGYTPKANEDEAEEAASPGTNGLIQKTRRLRQVAPPEFVRERRSGHADHSPERKY